MQASGFVPILAALLLAGCSGSSGLTTSSLFGEDEKPAEPAGPVSTPSTRAFQVGTVSARAIKCGFNFNPAKLKSNYLQYETNQGTAVTDMANVEKIYDASFNGVAKAVSTQGDYCTPTKVKTVKADLSRHLAGDYTPSAVPKAPEEEGIFSGWGSGGGDTAEMKRIVPSTVEDF